MTGPPLLSVRGLDCAYGRPARATPVVRDVAFDVAEGTTVALVGESGSGKTTVARAVAGLLAPRSGRIDYLGNPLTATVERRAPAELREIQYVFQNPDASLNPRQRVRDILARPLQVLLGYGAAVRERRIAALLADVQLDGGYARLYPSQLSGGERQRVAIARALAAEPRLLLCDEILTALDVSVQRRILDLLAALQAEHGLTYLFISHDLAAVQSLADDVVVLNGGEVMEQGPPGQLFVDPRHPYTRLLVDSIPRPGGRLLADTPAEPAADVAVVPGRKYAGTERSTAWPSST